jgi:hypothetical protein
MRRRKSFEARPPARVGSVCKRWFHFDREPRGAHSVQAINPALCNLRSLDQRSEPEIQIKPVCILALTIPRLSGGMELKLAATRL